MGNKAKQRQQNAQLEKMQTINLKLAEKISIIYEYQRIANVGVLAALHNIDPAQIKSVIRHKESILKKWDEKPRNCKKRPKMKNLAQREVIGAAVNEWVKRVRSYEAVSDNHIRVVAEEAAKLIRFRAFNATYWWVKKIKTKYKLNSQLPEPKCTKKPRKAITINDILLEFKNEGPPKYLPQHIFNHVDLQWVEPTNGEENNSSDKWTTTDSCAEFEIKEKRNSAEFQNNESQMTQLDEVSAANGDFITAMQMDDNDEEPPEFENKFSKGGGNDETRTSDTSAKRTNDTTAVITVTLEGAPSNKSDKVAIEEEEKDEEEEKHTISISSYKEALEYLKPLENFAVIEEDVKAIRKIVKLEGLFAEEL